MFVIKLSLTWIVWRKCYYTENLYHVKYSLSGQTLIGYAIFLHRFKKVFAESESASWSASYQGGMQALSLAVTLGMALFGGLLTGGCSVVCMLVTWVY